MVERRIEVVPEPRGGWRVTRPGDPEPLSVHTSATEAERTALRERDADEHVVIRDRYGRLRTPHLAQRR
jgi:Uncharacterized protein conserved in bacteria (DUF2188)